MEEVKELIRGCGQLSIFSLGLILWGCGRTKSWRIAGGIIMTVCCVLLLLSDTTGSYLK